MPPADCSYSVFHLSADSGAQPGSLGGGLLAAGGGGDGRPPCVSLFLLPTSCES